MRTLFGLFFSALIFYTIWFYFPDIFAHLLTFIAAIFNFFRAIIESIAAVVRDLVHSISK